MPTKHLDDSHKSHIINLYNRNYKVSAIADIYQTTNKTIYNIIDKHECTQTIKRKEGSGKTLNENLWNLI